MPELPVSPSPKTNVLEFADTVIKMNHGRFLILCDTINGKADIVQLKSAGVRLNVLPQVLIDPVKYHCSLASRLIEIEENPTKYNLSKYLDFGKGLC